MPLCYLLKDNILNYLDDAVEYQPHFHKLDWLRCQWHQLSHVKFHQVEKEYCHVCFSFVTSFWSKKTTQTVQTTHPTHKKFRHFSPHWEFGSCRKSRRQKGMTTAAPGHRPSKSPTYYCLTLVSVRSIVTRSMLLLLHVVSVFPVRVDGILVPWLA